MSGRRQHYLPRFLQRGFLVGDGSERTWMYRKNAEPRLIGIGDIGIERDFYSEEKGDIVDDAITDAERTQFSLAVQDARSAAIGTLLEGAKMSKLVAHIEIRTRHLRQAFLERSELMYSRTMTKLETPGLAEALLKRRWERDPSMLENSVREELRAKGLPESLMPSVVETMRQQLPAVTKELPFLMPLLTASIKPRIRQALKEGIKRGHLKALRKSIAPDVRIERYAGLRFFVTEARGADLILPDCGVVFRVAESDVLKPFIDKDDSIVAAILPITPNRLILGVAADRAFNCENLPEQIARCCYDFFVAAADSQQNRSIANQIRVNALPLSETEIDGVIEEVLNNELN
jgi:hypothetical protein